MLCDVSLPQPGKHRTKGTPPLPAQGSPMGTVERNKETFFLAWPNYKIPCPFKLVSGFMDLCPRNTTTNPKLPRIRHPAFPELAYQPEL